MRGLLLAVLLAAPLPCAAQGQAPAQPAAPPRDTTPPEAVFGVTEYHFERRMRSVPMLVRTAR